MNKNRGLLKKIADALCRLWEKRAGSDDDDPGAWHKRLIEELPAEEGDIGEQVSQEMAEASPIGDRPFGKDVELAVGPEQKAVGTEGKGETIEDVEPSDIAEEKEGISPAEKDSQRIFGTKSKYSDVEQKQIYRDLDDIPRWLWHPADRGHYSFSGGALTEGKSVDPIQQYRDAKEMVEGWKPEHGDALVAEMSKAQEDGDSDRLRELEDVNRGLEEAKEIVSKVEEAGQIMRSPEKLDELIAARDAATDPSEKEKLQGQIDRVMQAQSIIEQISPEEELQGHVMLGSKLDHLRREMQKIDGQMQDMAKQLRTPGADYETITADINDMNDRREQLIKEIKRGEEKLRSLEVVEQEQGLMRERISEPVSRKELLRTPPERALADYDLQDIYELMPFLMDSLRSPGMSGDEYYMDKDMARGYLRYTKDRYADEARRVEPIPPSQEPSGSQREESAEK